MSPPKGSLCLLLHGHLPFIRHPEKTECLEEDWFFEALTEVYLPLLEIFQRLRAEGVEFKVALSLSPTLTAMWKDPLLIQRYDRHLEQLIRLSEAECRRTAHRQEFAPLAQMYQERFLKVRKLWVDTFHRDLTEILRDLHETGHVELITTAATHGFLPLMEVTPEALKAQIEIGCESFRRLFGFRPAGFWLPECGYTPLIGKFLVEKGIRYTFVETHGLLHATPRPKFGVYAPIKTPEGLVLLGRDPETARGVWSSIDGYPGDFWYRDFYRDIGFDLPEQDLKPFLIHGGIRTATGIKYYRITGKTDQKEPYSRARALEKVQAHAGNFLFNRERQVETLAEVMGQPPVVVSLYDAELFGHWWFEGPEWLEATFRKFHLHRSVVATATPSEVLERIPTVQEVSPHLSTWGWKGYNEMWLQGANAWIYRHLHRAAWRMGQLRHEHPDAQGTLLRALTQALRELLLAQASDWAFILAQGTATEYARESLKRHLGRFTRLYEEIQRGFVQEEWLACLEAQDNLFDFLDVRVYPKSP